jgi:hypothetical protein
MAVPGFVYSLEHIFCAPGKRRTQVRRAAKRRSEPKTALFGEAVLSKKYKIFFAPGNIDLLPFQ